MKTTNKKQTTVTLDLSGIKNSILEISNSNKILLGISLDTENETAVNNELKVISANLNILFKKTTRFEFDDLNDELLNILENYDNNKHKILDTIKLVNRFKSYVAIYK